VVLLGNEEAEDRETLILAIDRWSQRRMLKKIAEFERLIERIERAARAAELVCTCRAARALAITLRTWLAEALPPAGWVGREGSIEKRE
jgi:hypothetical protein